MLEKRRNTALSYGGGFLASTGLSIMPLFSSNAGKLTARGMDLTLFEIQRFLKKPQPSHTVPTTTPANRIAMMVLKI